MNSTQFKSLINSSTTQSPINGQFDVEVFNGETVERKYTVLVSEHQLELHLAFDVHNRLFGTYNSQTFEFTDAIQTPKKLDVIIVDTDPVPNDLIDENQFSVFHNTTSGNTSLVCQINGSLKTLTLT